MQDFSAAFQLAFGLILSGDRALAEVIGLSLMVSGSATLIAAAIGLPAGAALASFPFPGRSVLVAIVHALLGLPPVVVGLFVYMMLSNAGPLGFLHLLYTPSAMIIAQAILVLPILVALSWRTIADLEREYRDLFQSLSVSPLARLTALVSDARASLSTALLAGFGRAIAEVGAVLMVGGNIAHVTRVMTTTIALETSRGELALAMALGLVLLAISLAINLLVLGIRALSEQSGHA